MRGSRSPPGSTPPRPQRSPAPKTARKVITVSDEHLELQRTVPDYGGRCITSVMPSILAGTGAAPLHPELERAKVVVLFVVDGLGWHQLRRNRDWAPSLAAACDDSSPMTTVAPSTTATALTSLTTGATPGEHGLVGYRVPTSLGLMNSLRWRAGGQDARALVPPEELQPVVPFCGQPAAVVTRAEFKRSGFTSAHLRGGTFWGWRNLGELVESVRNAVDAGAATVFAYYDTLDTVAHMHGLGEHYREALAVVEQLAVALRASLPDHVALAVTADHGMVEVLEPPIMIESEIVALTNGWSGEARMLWLHARAGNAADLVALCGQYSSMAEVAPVERVLDERWLGPHVSAHARDRIGDVALVPLGTEAFTMPDEDRPHHPLIGRHGGLTAEEMHVPFVVL